MTKPKLVTIPRIYAAFELSLQLCPACGAELSAATSLTGMHRPKDGDITICVCCAMALEYGPNLSVHPIDLAALSPDALKAIRQVQSVVQEFRKDHPLQLKVTPDA